jgi:hypothetical protein
MKYMLFSEAFCPVLQGGHLVHQIESLFSSIPLTFFHLLLLVLGLVLGLRLFTALLSLPQTRLGRAIADVFVTIAVPAVIIAGLALVVHAAR